MSEQKGYDPFADKDGDDAGETKARVVKDDPMDDLLTPSGVVQSAEASNHDDGWDPVVEEAWKLPERTPDLESMLQDDPEGVEPTQAISATASGSFDVPVHR